MSVEHTVRKDVVIAHLNNLIKEINETVKNNSLTSEQKNEIIGNISKISDSITKSESYYYNYPIYETKYMMECFGYRKDIEIEENTDKNIK